MKRLSLCLMAVFYLMAGINHWWHPGFYLQIMPPWLPWHKALVLISGIAEMFFAILLLVKPLRKFAAWGFILLLIAIFPANIQMMLNYWDEENPRLWMTILRLPLQIVLIYWAYRVRESSRIQRGKQATNKPG